jgi:hypothetical protein
MGSASAGKPRIVSRVGWSSARRRQRGPERQIRLARQLAVQRSCVISSNVERSARSSMENSR